MYKKIPNIFIVLILIAFLYSCKGERGETLEFREGYVEELAEESDVIATVNAQNELSEFAAALNTSLERSVQFEAYSYSIFAPNNEAFSLDEININDDQDRFNDVVQYHMMGEKLLLDDLKERLSNQEEPLVLYTLNGKELMFSLEGDRIVLTDEMGNKAYILKSTDALNGVVHVIDNTLIPDLR